MTLIPLRPAKTRKERASDTPETVYGLPDFGRPESRTVHQAIWERKHGVAGGIDRGGWRDPSDTPCLIIADSPVPDWQDMPAWLAREMRADMRREAGARRAEAPATDEHWWLDR